MFSKVVIESLRSTWDEVTPITARIGHWLTVGAEYQVKRERPKITHFLFTRSLRAPPILIETVLTRFLCSTTICYYEWFYPVEQLPLFRRLLIDGPFTFPMTIGWSALLFHASLRTIHAPSRDMSSGTPGGVIFDPDERSIYIEGRVET